MPNSFSYRLAVALFVSASVSASAAPANEHLRGVWSGTLGGAQVTACFGLRPTEPEVVGSYYYTKYREPLALRPKDGGHAFEETGGPLWTLAAAGPDALGGSWRKAGSDKPLPVRLTRLPGTSARDGCASAVFLQPVWAQVLTLAGGKPERLRERRYRPITLAGVQLLELIDASPGATAINRQLRAELALSAADEAATRDAVRDSILSLGVVALDAVSASVIEWDERLLTLDLHREFAGQGAAGVDSGYRSWDVRTGREIDPWTWFGLKSSDSKDEGPVRITRRAAMTDALRRVVLKAASNVKACREVYGSPLSARIRASAAGIEFGIGDTMRPECLQSVTVPLAVVRPLMTAAGREESQGIFGK